LEAESYLWKVETNSESMEAKCLYVEKKQSVDTGIIIRKKKGIKVFKVKV
jgi:hypothetical protein